MKKICWITGFGENYYNNIAVDTLKKWDLLDGDKVLLAEMDLEKINSNYKKIDIRSVYNNFDKSKIDKIFGTGKKIFKFFRKATSIWYGLTNLKDQYDYIIWLDSDVVVEHRVILDDLLPETDQLFSTIIKTVNGCDSGFVAFNTRHPEFEKFIDEYIDYYMSGKIWNFYNPYDAYILEDYSKKVNFKNLWTGICTDKSEYDCGFVDTKLQPFMTHYWGKKNKYKLEDEK
jgi:hypothetical protein